MGNIFWAGLVQIVCYMNAVYNVTIDARSCDQKNDFPVIVTQDYN